MWTILWYVIAFVTFAVVPPVVCYLLFAITLHVRRYHALMVVCIALQNLLALGGTFVGFAYLLKLAGADISPAMFILPWLLTLRNDLRRIDAAKKGKTVSGVPLPEDSDIPYQVKMEVAFLVGDIAGYVAGINLALLMPVV